MDSEKHMHPFTDTKELAAKGVTSGDLPLGGVLVGDRVAQVLTEKGGDFNHGFTFSGHPVACAVALENIAILKRENLVQQIHDDVGPDLKAKFGALLDHPLVGVANAIGLMAGLLLVRNKATMERLDADKPVAVVCRGHMFNNGMIMPPRGRSHDHCPTLCHNP